MREKRSNLSFYDSSSSMILFSHSLCQDDLGFSYGSAPRSNIGELIARMVKNQENAQMTQSTVDYQGIEERPAWVCLLSS